MPLMQVEYDGRDLVQRVLAEVVKVGGRAAFLAAASISAARMGLNAKCFSSAFEALVEAPDGSREQSLLAFCCKLLMHRGL